MNKRLSRTRTLMAATALMATGLVMAQTPPSGGTGTPVPPAQQATPPGTPTPTTPPGATGSPGTTGSGTTQTPSTATQGGTGTTPGGTSDMNQGERAARADRG